VIAPHGLDPGPDLALQRGEEFRAVFDVSRGVEGILEIRERLRMVLQIDLHATDIDRGDAIGLLLFDKAIASSLVSK